MSASALSSSGERSLSPRGVRAPFSGYDDCGPYPFEHQARFGNAKTGAAASAASAADESEAVPLAHDIYIWNGQSALALTKAVALTKCFELERYLINDDVGAVRPLRGRIHGRIAFPRRYVVQQEREHNYNLQ